MRLMLQLEGLLVRKLGLHYMMLHRTALKPNAQAEITEEKKGWGSSFF